MTLDDSSTNFLEVLSEDGNASIVPTK